MNFDSKVLSRTIEEEEMDIWRAKAPRKVALQNSFDSFTIEGTGTM